MDGNRTIDGQFWIAGQDDDRRLGYLKVGPRLPPVVEVIGELTSAFRVTGRHADGTVTSKVEVDDKPFMIHGVDSAGTKLTLVDAVSVNWSYSSEPRQRLQGSHAVVGAHLIDREQLFGQFRLRIENLNLWRRLLGNASWQSGGELESGGAIAFEAAASPRVWLVGKDVQQFTLRSLDRTFERPIISLFTLALGSACELLDVQVRDDSSELWWDVYTSSLQLDSGDATRSNSGWLLDCVDLKLHNLSTWLDRVEILGPLPSGVADLARADAISLETQVLQLASIAEGLHRALFPNETRFDAVKAALAREAAVTAVAEVFPGAKETVRSLLAYLAEPGYPARLKRLAEVVGDAVPGVTGNTNKWKALVTKARNDFAHRLSSDFLDSKDVDRYLTTALSLRWLLTGLLLLQADIPRSTLTERFNEHQQYTFFRRSVKEWQPGIYSGLAS